VIPAFRLSLTVCRAAEIGEGADMRGDPVRQLLAPDRLGVGKARSAQGGDEYLNQDDLAGAGVDHLGGTAGEISRGGPSILSVDDRSRRR
jgi:hypothetical protein